MLLPNLPPPVEGVRHQSHGVDAYISHRCLGSGTLFIAESRLSWAKENSTEGLSLEYPHIAIHGVSRDTSSFEHPCLYLMLDINIDDRTANGRYNEEQSDEEDDERTEMTEIRFVPRDATVLDFMYKSLNDCQVLHPDPEDQQSDDGDDEEEGDYEIGELEPLDVAEVYEMNMEADLEREQVGTSSNGTNERGDEDVEMGQFDDADIPEM